MNINTVDNWLKTIRNLICPGYCLLCEKPATNALCPACDADLPRISQFCTRCALPMDHLQTDSLICGDCLAEPPAFDRVLAPFRYAEPVDGMIRRFKYQQSLATGRILGEYLARYVATQAQPIDVIVPIPLHPNRLRQRGFNQAAELAHWLSRARQIPWHADVLGRIRAHPDQRGSNRRQRHQQVRGVFQARQTRLPRRIALIDDVVTTGATARAAALCLRRAGVEYIEVWAVARTAK